MSQPPADPTERFFDELASRAHEPLLRKASGSMRFDIVDGKRTRPWLVEVDDGETSRSGRGGGRASSVSTGRCSTRMATGELNAVAAVLRGDLEVEGDWRLLVRMQRLFPGPRRRRSSA